MTEKNEAFRNEVRFWLAENCPPEVRGPLRDDDDRFWGGRNRIFSSEGQKLWFERMLERKWIAPDWPVQYGGGGLGPVESKILREELGRIEARAPLSSFGLWMLGPALLKFGNEEQKRHFLPAIVRGEMRWAQGYSEPGAGSDLASLATRAVDKGDNYSVTGQKIWTSYADKADWIFCLVRTDAAAPKHKGISFLLFDMTSPGITVKPIKLISGNSPFCEVFLDEVQVPKSQLVGELNAGWDVAKYLLSHEREAQSSFGMREAPEALGAAVAERLEGEPVLRARFAMFDVRASAYFSAHQSFQEELKAGVAHAAKSSVMKYYGCEMNKQRQILMMEAIGTDGLAWDTADSLGVTPQIWLRSLGNSIEGGTSEIQLGIVAKRLLNLPSN